MDFEKAGKREKIVENIGYITTILIFSIIFYLVLSYLKKIPESWNYLYILGIVLLVILASKLLSRVLK